MTAKRYDREVEPLDEVEALEPLRLYRWANPVGELSRRCRLGRRCQSTATWLVSWTQFHSRTGGDKCHESLACDYHARLFWGKDLP